MTKKYLFIIAIIAVVIMGLSILHYNHTNLVSISVAMLVVISIPILYALLAERTVTNEF